jgi:hypothetical protein
VNILVRLLIRAFISGVVRSPSRGEERYVVLSNAIHTICWEILVECCVYRITSNKRRCPASLLPGRTSSQFPVGIDPKRSKTIHLLRMQKNKILLLLKMALNKTNATNLTYQTNVVGGATSRLIRF